MGVIYKITNNINGKSYIGQTNNFERRMREHKRCVDSSAIHCAIQKYGADSFTYKIIEECDDSLLNEREIYWINFYNTFKTGYNSTLGGDNADGLNQWRKNNPEKAKENALRGLKFANKRNKEHKEEHMQQLAKAREKAMESVKKKVYCVELDLTFNSIAEAERWSMSNENPNGKKASHQHISHVCSGQRKTTGGYHWKYITI